MRETAGCSTVFTSFYLGVFKVLELRGLFYRLANAKCIFGLVEEEFKP